MTDKTQPEALRLADAIKASGQFTNLHTLDEASAELRRQHARIAELEAELEAMTSRRVLALSAAPAWKQGSLVTMNQEPYPALGEWFVQFWEGDDVAARVYGNDRDTLSRRCAMLAASPTPPAEQQAATKAAPGDALDEVMRERDDAEDFINELLDEVLGADRPEWSSAYNRYDAMSDVRERITALHKPAVDKAWGQFQSAMAAPQQEAQEPCQTCTATARTVMMDQVSFDRKPDCYAIRQITDDEGVEEWEDIRTSPDVAREEANNMMATRRGEVYEVVPLWTTPQPAPAPLSDAQIKELIEDGVFLGNCKEIVRAIEQAHGITQKGGSNAE